MPPVEQDNVRFFTACLCHIAESDNSLDTTRENSTYLRSSRTTIAPETQQAPISSADLPKSYDLRPPLKPRDYLEKVIQNKIPPRKRCLPISGPAVSSSQLTQSEKRDAIIDWCQPTRTLPSSSEIQTDPNVHNAHTHFRNLAHSTPPG